MWHKINRKEFDKIESIPGFNTDIDLKEAIYNGISNFRYIDRILYEWNKKGLKNKEDVGKMV